MKQYSIPDLVASTFLLFQQIEVTLNGQNMKIENALYGITNNFNSLN
jgi:hypothetical protein